MFPNQIRYTVKYPKMKPYHLMSSLHGHTSDVKSLCITNESGGFASVSRDITCKVWEFASTQYVQSKVFEKIHTKYVNAVAVAYTLSEFPKGLIMTGSNDQTIAIVCLETSEVVAQLKEHDGAGFFSQKFTDLKK
jgi:WD40 repeat protein